MHEELLRIEDAARVLKLSRTTVYDLLRRGELRIVRVGRAVRIPRSEIERFARERLTEFLAQA
jgi:putative molybdopterin biosynthesis protein